MTSVRLRGVTVRFGDRSVLAGVDAELAEGTFVALLGRSGSGKSTLLNAVAGIEAIDAGEIWVGSQRVDALGEPDVTLLRRRTMGFVFQAFNLIPTLTVLENVTLPRALNGMPDDQPPIRELMARIGLEGVDERYPETLSGGEQQRVAIARALAHGPTLVLADEPTGNLDWETGRRVAELLESLCREEGCTLLLATHDRELADQADQRLTLMGGKLVPTESQ